MKKNEKYQNILQSGEVHVYCLGYFVCVCVCVCVCVLVGHFSTFSHTATDTFLRTEYKAHPDSTSALGRVAKIANSFSTRLAM